MGEAIAKFGAIEDWDVHLVTSMRGLFRWPGDYNAFLYTHWNTSSVTDMGYIDGDNQDSFKYPEVALDTNRVYRIRKVGVWSLVNWWLVAATLILVVAFLMGRW